MKNITNKDMKATLVLDNGICFEGTAFGCEKSTVGEVVFCTSMTGYTESLTDATYAGQILVLTYPLIGNYGVPSHEVKEEGLEKFFESEKIQVRGLIVTDYSEEYSHWNAVETLDAWMKREEIPGITGIDTRALTKVLRENGVMGGKIVIEENETLLQSEDYENVNYVEIVSCKQVARYNEGASKKVVLIDCGTKFSLIRSLMDRNVEVVRVPFDYDFSSIDYDALVISNGPGNPILCTKTIENIRKAMMTNKPILGVGLGNQLLGLAANAKVEKLKFGHRGANQPSRLKGSNSCYITNQNVGYTIAKDSLPVDWDVMFVNMNDDTIDGICHKTNPWNGVQFNPEAYSRGYKKNNLVDDFLNLIK